ncbi:hypothetical protein RHEph02_gp060 [Rhizobium phage RHEph02]|uniref:Uncharacterized protein n=1 Tax=Rhizobium phage RHEph02 TaxID=1220602 RepID=L7TM51_9CAUD|nr:hypothetical protein HOS21_gp60 [Rhizobium phage RHEph02]AGC35627.1 hypothetical protein RHEph02_gp060 [Rhizobium phage RHEph02]
MGQTGPKSGTGRGRLSDLNPGCPITHARGNARPWANMGILAKAHNRS